MRKLAEQLEINKMKTKIKAEYNEEKETKHKQGTNPIKRQV